MSVPDYSLGWMGISGTSASMSAATRASGGTGLGLAIVKHVLERHQGHLSISSEINRGSEFTCHFPLHRISARDRSEHKSAS